MYAPYSPAEVSIFFEDKPALHLKNYKKALLPIKAIKKN